ncbi:transcriptional regulator [Mycobacterium tuberculosis TKK-01-0058]|nr:transcriptional regulator [Mycobacterium tuberculosis TKK-01-0058]
MARNWRDIRADAVAQGRVDLQRAAVAREEMRDAVLAHRLAEIRKALGHARQADVAALMGVSQARVSKLESGDLSHTELGTLNRPGMSGDSSSWKGWGHVRWFIEEVPAGAA